MSEIMSGLIPAQVLTRKDLTQTSKLIFGIIHGFNFNERQCFASNKTIGEAIGVDARSVSRAISDLVSANLITSTEVNEQRILTVVTLVIKPSAIDKNVLPPRQECPTPHDKNVLHNNNINNNINNKFFLEESKKTEENILTEVDVEAELLALNHLKPLVFDIEQDSRYTLLRRRPMKKYPRVWLTGLELKNLLESCKARKVEPKTLFAIVNAWVDEQVLEGKPEKNIHVLSALTSWGMERALSLSLLEIKIENQESYKK